MNQTAISPAIRRPPIWLIGSLAHWLIGSLSSRWQKAKRPRGQTLFARPRKRFAFTERTEYTNQARTILVGHIDLSQGVTPLFPASKAKVSLTLERRTRIDCFTARQTITSCRFQRCAVDHLRFFIWLLGCLAWFGYLVCNFGIVHCDASFLEFGYRFS